MCTILFNYVTAVYIASYRVPIYNGGYMIAMQYDKLNQKLILCYYDATITMHTTILSNFQARSIHIEVIKVGKEFYKINEEK